MAKRHIRTEKTRKRRSVRPYHAVPDLFFAAAAAVPFAFGPATGVSALQAGPGEILNGVPVANALVDFTSNLTANLRDNAKPAVTLLVAGLVAKWAGKKVGANRIGTKKVKLA